MEDSATTPMGKPAATPTGKPADSAEHDDTQVASPSRKRPSSAEPSALKRPARSGAEDPDTRTYKYGYDSEKKLAWRQLASRGMKDAVEWATEMKELENANEFDMIIAVFADEERGVPQLTVGTWRAMEPGADDSTAGRGSGRARGRGKGRGRAGAAAARGNGGAGARCGDHPAAAAPDEDQKSETLKYTAAHGETYIQADIRSDGPKGKPKVLVGVNGVAPMVTTTP